MRTLSILLAAALMAACSDSSPSGRYGDPMGTTGGDNLAGDPAGGGDELTGGDEHTGGDPTPSGLIEIDRDAGVYAYQPDIYGTRVVFAREEGNGTRDNIFLYDLVTTATTQITNLAKTQGTARIHGDNIVWVDHRNLDNDENVDLYLYDLGSSTEHQVTTDPEGQYGHDVFERLIVWRDDRNRGGTIAGDIYGYDMGPDLAFGTADDVGEFPIATGAEDQTAPDVYVNDAGRATVVYYQGPSSGLGDDDVYLVDSGDDGLFGTGDDVGPVAVAALVDTDQKSPAIYGRRVVWLDDRGGNWLDPDIYVYDLGPDEIFGTVDDVGESLVDIPTVEPGDLHLWGDRLVFDDYREGSWEVWVYDFGTGSETQITDSVRGQFYPRIYEDTVVWQDGRNNAGTDLYDDIYGTTLD